MKDNAKRLRSKTSVFVQILVDFISLLLAQYLFFNFAINYADNNLYRRIYDFLLYDQQLLIYSGVSILFLSISFIGGFFHSITRQNTISAIKNGVASSILTTIIVIIVTNKLLPETILRTYPLFYTFGFALFSFSSLSRLLLIWRRYILINQLKSGYNTIIIGSNSRSLVLYKELSENRRINGNILIGFVDNTRQIGPLSKQLAHLGELSQLKEILIKHKVDEIIVTSTNILHLEIQNAISNANLSGIIIRVMPEMKSILSGAIRTTDILGPNLVTLKNDLMPRWQIVIKTFLDITISTIALILLFPIMLIIGISVKLTSKGSMFYTQERIGKHGVPFRIIKFRSMVFNAEADGPELSSTNDSRITKVGRILRKWRLDELPQFLNVILGQMSLVGPRPERRHYADQLMSKIPHYQYIFMVKPGITSWGMVKYGYAENIGEMITRSKYDIIYIENMSLLVDLKIGLHTLRTLILGRGK